MSTKVKTAMDNAQDMIDAGVDTAQRAVARTADRADEALSDSRRAAADRGLAPQDQNRLVLS